MAQKIVPPPSFLFKPMKVQWKELFKSVTTLATGVFTGNLESAAGALAGILTSFTFDKAKPGEVAWTWIARSLVRAVAALVKDQPQIPKRPMAADVEKISEELAERLADKEVRLEKAVFLRPQETDFVQDFQGALSEWLQQLGLEAATAVTVSGRLPGYLAVALDEEWLERPDDYKQVKEAIDGPASAAAKEELAWRSYFARLRKEIDEPVFDEPFGLDQIYIWPRAYYEEALAPDGERPDYADFRKGKVKRTPFWLKDELLKWLNNTNPRDAVRVISGGPGSGKSSFTKMLSAELAQQGAHVLRIPLDRLNLQKDWETAISDYVQRHAKLALNPFDPAGDKSSCLVILDGVDELVQEGKAAEELVTGFLDHVKRELRITNEQRLRVRVMISGREYAIQSHRSSFREEHEVLHLLPYYVGKKFRKAFHDGSPLPDLDDRDDVQVDSKESPQDGPALLDLDQRDEWWKKYGTCKGLGYEECPSELKEGVFGPLIGQPLLNHLVARTYQEGRIDFSKETNPNAIYEEMINSVYHRKDWAGTQFEPISRVLEEEFNHFLEETAVCAWHGGRCASIDDIEERCQAPQLQAVLQGLGSRAKTPVNLILTAFFFRRGREAPSGDQTVEFTHKTFYEYLAARRIVRELQNIARDLGRRRKDPYDGCDANAALIRWTRLCGPRAMDEGLFTFLASELRLRPEESVVQWQEELKELIGHTLKHGMPMHDLGERLTYLQETQRSRNAEEALLACISACAGITKKNYDIEWPESTSAGDWITRLRGQRKETQLPHCFPLTLLNYASLEGQSLFGQDLVGANLRDANLMHADLRYANLMGADLTGANLKKADMYGANLWGAGLTDADLTEAILTDADLTKADLLRANLKRAYVTEADLGYANLRYADLTGAVLRDANLSDALLKHANFMFAKLTFANLTRATLIDAKMTQADLREANLEGANLDRVDLSGADLTGANLDGCKGLPKGGLPVG